MLTPNFNPRPDVFSDEEKTFIKDMVQKISEACNNCENCDHCIYSNFCEHTVYDGCRTSPDEILIDFFAILGVEF